MKKTDVYVVVDTPKKAKKLKKVLDMFKIAWHINQFDNNTFYFEDDSLYSSSGSFKRTKVSIKELRNILAKEHLRPGDVVALGYGKSVEYIGIFKAFNNGYFKVDRYLSLNSGSGILMNDSGYIKNFIRYATEEEKALLEPYDKLSSLKEEYNNGYCVEFYDEKTDKWKRHENPCWNPDLQWRIMVNNGHLVISDVYLLNQIKELKKSIKEIKSNIR